jgi:hypothetical protein
MPPALALAMHSNMPMVWRPRTLLCAASLCFLAAPPVHAEPEPPPRAAPGLLALPFVGVHSYQGTSQASYMPGPRLGAIVGGRLVPWLSIDAEVTYDRSLFHGGVDASESFVDLSLSPLLHVVRGPVEIVFGPEVGYFRRSSSGRPEGLGLVVDDSSTGFAAGLNAGVFGRLNRHVSLGGLLSFELRKDRRYCVVRPGQAEICTTSTFLDSGVVLFDYPLFSVTAAALF